MPNLLVQDGFQAGSMIDVFDGFNELLFTGRVSKLDDGSVILLAANGPVTAPVGPGSPVRLRGQLSSSRRVSYSGVVCSSNRLFWKINQLGGRTIQESSAGENRRDFFRQPVSVDAWVMLLRRAGETENASGAPAECKLLNISGGGVALSATEVFGRGDHLMVAEAELLEGQPPFDFSCEVRRVQEAKQGYVYGCQFAGLSEQEQTRLINAVFQLQQRERNRWPRR